MTRRELIKMLGLAVLALPVAGINLVSADEYESNEYEFHLGLPKDKAARKQCVACKHHFICKHYPAGPGECWTHFCDLAQLIEVKQFEKYEYLYPGNFPDSKIFPLWNKCWIGDDEYSGKFYNKCSAINPNGNCPKFEEK